MKANVPEWQLLSLEMNKIGTQVRWEHTSAHINVYGNELAKGLAVEGMCSNLLGATNMGQE